MGPLLDAYEDWDDGPEPPRALDQMREAVRAAIAHPGTERDAIIGRVLRRSLLEPTGKTYYDTRDGRPVFVMVEPKLTRSDVEEWARRR